MKRLIDWLDKGKRFIGYDNSGDPMFSMSNKEAVEVFIVLASAFISLVIIIVRIVK